MRWVVACGLVLAFAGLALAADEVLLNDGSAVEGEIQSIDENAIVLSVDGKTLTLEPENVDAHYYYEQWAKRAAKDAETHLKLAVFAFQNGLFSQAKSQYHKAQRLDAALVRKFEEEVVPRIKEGVAQNLLELAKQAVAREDWDQARRLAAKILTELEDTKAAEEARGALASIHIWQLSKDQERLVRSLAKYLPKEETEALKVQDRVVKKLEPIENRIRKTQDEVARGLLTKSANRQKGIFERSAKRFTDIVKDLDKLSADAEGDEALLAYIAEMRATAVRDGIDAYVHAGGVYLIRRSYDQAIQMANAALALDPNSQEAQRFYQQTIRGSQMRGWGRR